MSGTMTRGAEGPQTITHAKHSGAASCGVHRKGEQAKLSDRNRSIDAGEPFIDATTTGTCLTPRVEHGARRDGTVGFGHDADREAR